jgi:putative ABC transport system substrate-binding protein
MRRRDLIKGIAGSTAAWPLAVRAQQKEPLRSIGMLMPFAETDPEGKDRVTAFLQEFRKLGWIEGRNIRIDHRWAAGDPNLMRAYASELVGLKPDIIVCQNAPIVAALLKETRAIPILFTQVTDPVGNHFVQTLARPGGNITGFTNFEFSMGSKWIELLKEVDQRVVRVAIIFNPDTGPHVQFILPSIEVAASSFAIKPMAIPLNDTAAIEGTIAEVGREAGGGLAVMPEPFTALHRDLIITLAAKHRVPAVYPFRYFTIGGGLISYGIDPLDPSRRAAGYADRILRGEKPSDLPVQEPSKFQLVINLKTAKTLGLTVPPTLLARADEVIE